MGETYDILLTGGHVIDPANHIDEQRDVGITTAEMTASVRSVSDAMQAMTASMERSTQTSQEMASQANQVTEAMQAITSLGAEHGAATTWAKESAELTKQHVKVAASRAQQLTAAADDLLATLNRSDDDAPSDDALPQDPSAAAA